MNMFHGVIHFLHNPNTLEKSAMHTYKGVLYIVRCFTKKIKPVSSHRTIYSTGPPGPPARAQT
jgi:hypothetical protein